MDMVRVYWAKRTFLTGFFYTCWVEFPSVVSQVKRCEFLFQTPDHDEFFRRYNALQVVKEEGD